jgi:hypothetical protein
MSTGGGKNETHSLSACRDSRPRYRNWRQRLGSPEMRAQQRQEGRGRAGPGRRRVGQTGPDDFSSSADAARAYFNCVNENGGINGRPIEYLVEDDQWNPEVAGQVATKLVKDKKVVALVSSGSFVEMGVNAKLYEDEGVMSMAAACAVAECFESRNIVSTNEGPLPSTIGAAQWAVANLGSKNVVCIGLTIPICRAVFLRLDGEIHAVQGSHGLQRAARSRRCRHECRLSSSQLRRAPIRCSSTCRPAWPPLSCRS